MSPLREKLIILKELQEIPGVGVRVAEDLWNLGVRSIEDLRNENPEILYEDLCDIQGGTVDRCMLYVLRCAVYYASHKDHDPTLLKWWNWKDN